MCVNASAVAFLTGLRASGGIADGDQINMYELTLLDGPFDGGEGMLITFVLLDFARVKYLRAVQASIVAKIKDGFANRFLIFTPFDSFLRLKGSIYMGRIERLEHLRNGDTQPE